MPELHKTNWDTGVFKAQYRKDELQPRQPKGFPIIPFPSTVARAREEAEVQAAARSYSKLEFEIYEDAGYNGKEVLADDTEGNISSKTEKISGEKDGDDVAGGNSQHLDEKDTEEALSPSTSATEITQKPATLIDSHGRTRAATNRRKALESIQLEDSPKSPVEKEENRMGHGKKRRWEGTQASKQLRKWSVKKSG